MIPTLLLRKIGLRHALLAPGQTALLVAILALGVGVFMAVRLANRAAVASFSHFTDTLTGGSDWIIQAPAGDLPESVLPELRDALAGLAVQLHPVVEATAAEPPPPDREDGPRFGRRTYTMLGVDLVAVANLAPLRGGEGRFFRENTPSTANNGNTFFDLFDNAPLVWVSPALPRQGTILPLLLNDRIVDLKIAGSIPRAQDGPSAPAELLVMDLPRLQALAGRPGHVSRIECVVEDGADVDRRRAETGRRLEQLGTSPDGTVRWLVSTPGARRDTAATMTEAFRLNLTVLSLIALLVGLYLVFQALDGAVARRRAEIATLRSLGVSASELRRAWLVEAALLGLLGGALGVGVGWLGAQIAVRAVGATINALYFSTTVNAAQLGAQEAALGLLAGIGASMIAGWVPARTAANTPPAQILVRSAPGGPGGAWLRSWPLAATALTASWLLTRLPPLDLGGGTRFPLAGHAASFLAILGGGILASLALPGLARAARPLATRGAGWRIALSHLARPTGRHRLAAAALVCAIAMAAGMAILVGSFERSVKSWIASALQADLYLASAGAQSAGSTHRLPADTWQSIASHPAVASAAVFTAYPIRLDDKPTTLGGGDLQDQARRGGFLWVGAPPPEEALDPARNEGYALISESFAERFGVRAGEQLTLPTPSGSRVVKIAAVFADYGNERGSVLVDRSHTTRWFEENQASSLALYLKDGADPRGVRAELLAQYPGVAMHTNAALRSEVLTVFRQTFSITYALEAIGLIVAVVGLGLSLASVLLDRRDELATLRSLGFSKNDIARASAIEGGGLAAIATLTGLALSFGLGWILIHIVNKQSFGWTLAFDAPAPQLAALAVAVIGSGALASYIAGWRSADLPADRED